MAVPKRKTSKSKRGMRRAHHVALQASSPVANSTTGEWQLPHRVSLDGYYRGKKVIFSKSAKKEADS